jgi:hypothetical protein
VQVSTHVASQRSIEIHDWKVVNQRTSICAQRVYGGVVAYDTAILDSVWSAFLEVAAGFPNDAGVITTLQSHGWYSRQCTILAQRTESTLLGALGDNHHSTDIAAECRKAAAQDAVTPQGKRLQQLIREHGNQRSLDEPKPRKKPWDK